MLSFLWHTKSPVQSALTSIVKFKDLTMERDLGTENMIGFFNKKHEWHLNFLHRAGKACNESHLIKLCVFKDLLDHLRILLIR